MKQIALILAATLLSLAAYNLVATPTISNSHELQFKTWCSRTNKVYKSVAEYNYRLSVFSKNFELVKAHNAKNLGWKLGLHFGDLTDNEILIKYTGLNKDFFDMKNKLPKFKLDSSLSQSASKNWINEGAVGPVKNQGSCGSCWAFSAVSQLESHEYIKNKRSVTLSEQQLNDCSWSFGNMGCNGGLMHYAYNYLMSGNRGITTERQYPYTARDGRCTYSTATATSWLSKAYFLNNGEPNLQNAVATLQPIAVAINMSPLMRYTSGIFNQPSCAGQINHAVNVVGFDTSGGVPYWLVRNSWGSGWGESGYFRIYRGTSTTGQCSIATYMTLVDVQ